VSASDAGHPFPSLEWMQAYAGAVGAHPRAAQLATALEGRYRFTITPGAGLAEGHAYDLVVAPGPSIAAAAADPAQPAALAVTTDYGRWKGLLTGKADFVLSFLMRRIKVEGDVGAIRSRLDDARPLLDCLRQVPTAFPH
jgi:hypothetical protein